MRRRELEYYPWTEDQIATLRRLWDEGLSTAKIGLRLGCSKNAVIGKVRRIGLARRPHIIPTFPWTAERVAVLQSLHARGAGALTIGQVIGCSASCVVRKMRALEMPGAGMPVNARTRRVAPSRTLTTRKPVKGPVAPIQAKRGPCLRVQDIPPPRDCQFPHGEPRTEGFGFCGQPSVRGRPYCREHCEVAYTNVQTPAD